MYTYIYIYICVYVYIYIYIYMCSLLVLDPAGVRLLGEDRLPSLRRNYTI